MSDEKNARIIKLIDGFNDGSKTDEIIKLSHGIDNFIKMVASKGLLSKLNPFSENFSDDTQTKIVIAMLNDDTTGNVLRNIASECCYDVNYRDGDYYYVGANAGGKLEDLASFFETGYRTYSKRDIASGILSGEYLEMFSINDFDAYSDVVNVLNIENQERLKNYILKHHNGFEFEDGTILGQDNIDDSINDQTYFDEIYQIDDDLEQELFNIYSQSYNDAWEEEQSKYVFEALEEYFDMSNLWRDIGGGVWKLNIKIRNFEKIIRDYLDLAVQDTVHSINYYGSFEHLVTTLMDHNTNYEYLTFHFVEHPYGVEKSVNELFGDYI